MNTRLVSEYMSERDRPQESKEAVEAQGLERVERWQKGWMGAPKNGQYRIRTGDLSQKTHFGGCEAKIIPLDQLPDFQTLDW